MSYCRNESAHYFLCWSCGLIFRHPLPTSRFMAAWTDEKYASGAYHDYVSARPMKLRHFEERLDDLRTIIRPDHLLDVDCSCGYFMEVAAGRGFDVYGVEFSSSATVAAAPEIRSRIFEGKLEDMPEKGCSTLSARSMSSSTRTTPGVSSAVRAIAEARGVRENLLQDSERRPPRQLDQDVESGSVTNTRCCALDRSRVLAAPIQTSEHRSSSPPIMTARHSRH
jgi:hypothetical protein